MTRRPTPSKRDLRRDLEDLRDTEARLDRVDTVGDLIAWYQENDPDRLADIWRAALTQDGDGDRDRNGNGGEE
jgi:hypothetical protein